MPPPASTLPSRKRKVAPHGSVAAPSSPSHSETSADPADTEYEPSPSARALPKRNKAVAAAAPSAPVAGNNPLANGSARAGTSAGSIRGGAGRQISREALRKANHSLIERRRREKINAALSELRDMVPGLGDAGGGKGGEFKLEVLERTVTHMKELKAHIADVEARLAKRSSSSTGTSASCGSDTGVGTKARKAQAALPSADKRKIAVATPKPRNPYSTTPPTPSQSPDRHIASPDPNETDLESNLPPALTIASRPTVAPSYLPPPTSRTPSPPNRDVLVPSITSLLASVPDRPPLPLPSSRPHASSAAFNPTLYLPFPTPSPTSPFLSYGQSSSGSSSGPPEPSPFLAPLQGMALFGGALSLDTVLAPSPADTFIAEQPSGHIRSSNVVSGAKERRSSKEQEEAANLLLAFSSPDVMRPAGAGYGTGMTPLVAPIAAAECLDRGTREGNIGLLERRSTPDSDEFVLDGGTAAGGASVRRTKRGNWSAEADGEVRGKTARDILRM